MTKNYNNLKEVFIDLNLSKTDKQPKISVYQVDYALLLLLIDIILNFNKLYNPYIRSKSTKTIFKKIKY